MFDILSTPPNLTLGPPPKPPWILQDFSCAGENIVLHVNFRAVSTASSIEQYISPNEEPDMKTINVLLSLIGIMALLLTGLAISMYFYKRKVLKTSEPSTVDYQPEYQYVQNRSERNKTLGSNTAANNGNRISVEENGCNSRHSDGLTATPLMPNSYCNIIIPSYNNEVDYTTTTMDKTSSSTSGISSDGQENQFSLKESSASESHFSKDRSTPNIFESFSEADTYHRNCRKALEVLKKKHLEKQAERKRLQRTHKHPEAVNTSNGDTYNVWSNTYISLPRADFQWKDTVGFCPSVKNELESTLASYHGRRATISYGKCLHQNGSAHYEPATMAPYRHSRKRPYMGIRSITQTSLTSKE